MQHSPSAEQASPSRVQATQLPFRHSTFPPTPQSETSQQPPGGRQLPFEQLSVPLGQPQTPAWQVCPLPAGQSTSSQQLPSGMQVWLQTFWPAGQQISPAAPSGRKQFLAHPPVAGSQSKFAGQQAF